MRKYDRLADEQLIEELRAGNREIMDYIMVKYKSMVRRKARAMYLLGGENEDLIQEALPLQVSRSCVCPGRCTVRLRRLNEKNTCL